MIKTEMFETVQARCLRLASESDIPAIQELVQQLCVLVRLYHADEIASEIEVEKHISNMISEIAKKAAASESSS
jgi:N-acetylglutamate synthase-like GNAT family acetyltransferase